MLEAYEVIRDSGRSAALETVLTYGERQKSRYRAKTNCGQTIGWFLERGIVLADGDLLVCQDGSLVRVTAAAETVSQVDTADALLLTRIAYHLGNRHVPLQIGSGFVRYLHDHVLDDMVAGLGADARVMQLPFHPESGAYHSHSTSGGHVHAHAHSHGAGASAQAHAHSHSVGGGHAHASSEHSSRR